MSSDNIIEVDFGRIIREPNVIQRLFKRDIYEIRNFIAEASALDADGMNISLRTWLSRNKNDSFDVKTFVGYHAVKRGDGHEKIVLIRQPEYLPHILIQRNFGLYFSLRNLWERPWDQLIEEGQQRAEECVGFGLETRLAIYLPDDSGYLPTFSRFRPGEKFADDLILRAKRKIK